MSFNGKAGVVDGLHVIPSASYGNKALFRADACNCPEPAGLGSGFLQIVADAGTFDGKNNRISGTRPDQYRSVKGDSFNTGMLLGVT